MLTSLFAPAAAVLLLAVLLVALAQRSPGGIAQRLRILSMSLRLDSGEFTVTEIRSKCTEAAAKLIDLRSVAPDKRDADWAVAAKDAAAEVHDYNELAGAAEANERAAWQQLAWDQAVAEDERRAKDPNHRGGRGPDGALVDTTNDFRSIGQEFTQSEMYRDRRGYTVGDARAVDGPDAPVPEVRNLLTGSIGTSGSNNLALIGQPYLHTPSLRRRRMFVRDLMTTATTGLQLIPYVQELNAITNETGATTVSEASAKPEVTMQFTPAEAPARKIAAWIQVTEEAFADAPTLRSYVDDRLVYMVYLEEEDQILSGNGTAPNISGVLDQSGLQTQAAIAEDLAGTIGLAAGKVENVDGFIDGVAINPITYWTGVVERHANQMDGGHSDAGLPFRDAPPGIWGVPVVRTRALAANKAIVGNWQQGATIFDRTAISVRSTDSHASLFISNTLVVLAEKRTALAVWRPDFFVDTTLSFS
jgi:HK97 family phage major capsid protein